MQIRNVTTRRSYLTFEHEGEEVELGLAWAPEGYRDPLVAAQGDTAVVAYLVYDQDPCNPMKDSDCQGDLYTNSREGVITDDESSLLGALCLNGGRWGGPEVDIDRVFPVEPYTDPFGHQFKKDCLWDMAARNLFEVAMSDPDYVEEFFEHLDWELEEGETMEQAVAVLVRDPEFRTQVYRNLHDCNGLWSEKVETLAVELYSEHWQKLAGPFVVPVNYCARVHGPGTTSIGVDSWDGDPNEPPNAVWVADKGAEDNIRATCCPEGVQILWRGALGSEKDPLHTVVMHEGKIVFDAGTEKGSWGRAQAYVDEHFGAPTDEDLHKKACEYAAAVLDEYKKWCNGEVFGCVVEVFKRGEDGTWELPDAGHDSCWGFIGEDYAQKVLEEDYFNPACKREFKQEVTG